MKWFFFWIGEMVFKARDRRDYCQTIIGFCVTEFVTENVTDCDVSWLTWHPLLNISNHSNTPPDSLTCRRPLAHKKLTDMPILGGLSGSNNTTTAFWTHSFSLFCQKYLLIVCVCAAKFLSHNSKGAWKKKANFLTAMITVFVSGPVVRADQGQWRLRMNERAPHQHRVKLKAETLNEF